MTAGELLDEALLLRVELFPAIADRAKLLAALHEALGQPWAPVREWWFDPSTRPADPPGTIPMPEPARRRKVVRRDRHR